MKSDPKDLLKKHQDLTHSESVKVISHVQRESDEWFINTLLIEDCDVPFKCRRKKRYKNLEGQRVNLTYYPNTESIAGLDMEIMSVVRIKVS